jgi:Ca-activated chloride channel homolog
MRAQGGFIRALIAVWVLAACDQSQQNYPRVGATPPSAKAETPQASALVTAWPPATGNPQDRTRDSKNLFARNYYVVLDASASMKAVACSAGQQKIDAARAALAAFAASLPADANLGLQVFDDNGIRERLPLGTDNRERFREALGAVRAGGSTPLRESIRQAYQQLTAQGARQFGYGEYHLVVVTDGEADAGQNPEPVVTEIIQRSPVVLHTIGFCIGTNHSLNQPGRTLYRAADNPEQLKQGLGNVLAEAPRFDAAKFK